MENDATEKKAGMMAEALRQLAPYSHLGWQLFSTVALFVLIGALADRFFHSSPVALIAGAVAGIGIGLYSLIRSAKKLMQVK